MVSSWLGHSHLDMTKRYVHMAGEYYYQDQGSWLKRAIISPSKTKVRCKHVKTSKNQKPPQKGTFEHIFSSKTQRAWRDSKLVLEGILGETKQFFSCFGFLIQLIKNSLSSFFNFSVSRYHFLCEEVEIFQIQIKT